jgi:hypothetical protein
MPLLYPHKVRLLIELINCYQSHSNVDVTPVFGNYDLSGTVFGGIQYSECLLLFLVLD